MSTISGKPVNLPPGVVTPEVTDKSAVVDTKGTIPAVKSSRPAATGDAYDTDDVPGVNGPGQGAAPGELETEIYTYVFKPAGLPNPYNGNTYPPVEKKVASDPAFQPARDALNAYLANPTPQNQQAIVTALHGLPVFGNVMETLLAVIKMSVQDANQDKRYYLKKLESFNKIADKLSEQLNYLADKSSELSRKEAGAKHPEKEQVQLTDLKYYNTKTVGVDGEPVVSETKNEAVTRNSLGTRMKDVESQQESVRNERQMAQTAFQAIDQRVNQLYQIMAQVSKTMNEERSAPARNML